MTRETYGPPWTAERIRALGLTTKVATAAEILGIGRSTAYELISRRQFPVPVIYLGNRVMVPTAPLIALLEGTALPPSDR